MKKLETTESKNEKSQGQEKAGSNFKNLEFRNKIKMPKRFERKEGMRSSATCVPNFIQIRPAV